MATVCTPLTWARADVTFSDSSLNFSSVETCVTGASRGGGGRRYRIIGDPYRLCEELRVEEKKLEKDKKKLVILIKRLEAPNVQGVLYQQIEAKVAKQEEKIDNRLQVISQLAALIQQAFENDEDDAMVALLS